MEAEKDIKKIYKSLIGYFKLKAVDICFTIHDQRIEICITLASTESNVISEPFFENLACGK